MTIPVQCSSCKAKLKADERLAGKQIKCPKCKFPLSIPKLSNASASSPQLDFPMPQEQTNPGVGMPSNDSLPMFDDLAFEQPQSNNFQVFDTSQNTQQPAVKKESESIVGKFDSKAVLVSSCAAIATFLLVVTVGLLLLPSSNSIVSGNPVASDKSQPSTTPSIDLATSKAEPSSQKTGASTLSKSPSSEPAPVASTSPQSEFVVGPELKASTVLLKMTTSSGVKLGTGFLVHQSDGEGLVATDQHNIRPTDSVVHEIDCVFYSGTKEEFTVKSSVASMHLGTALMLLNVKHPNIPKSIFSDGVLAEANSFWTVGYRDTELATSKCQIQKQPNSYEPLISELTNSQAGGPVVTDSGKVVGVAIRTQGAGGLLIPQAIVRETIQGNALRFRAKSRQLKQSSISCLAEITDPLGQIQLVSVIGFKNQVITSPSSIGKWEQATDKILLETTLERNGNYANATIDLPNGSPISNIQLRVTRKDGSTWFSFPYGISDMPMFEQSNESSVDYRVLGFEKEIAGVAMNYVTGDIATISPSNKAAFLIRAVDYEPRIEPRADAVYRNVKLESTPISIVYKKYADTDWFVLACDRDSYVYFLNTSTFEEVKKVKLAKADVKKLAVSANSKDPFIYYVSESGGVGVLDARNLMDRGEVIDSVTSLILSSDGMCAYCNETLGFRSLRMKSTFADELPQFAKVFSYRNELSKIVPDARGEYSAIGGSIFVKDMSQQVFSYSSFKPKCFLKERPVALGLDHQVLRAVSTNDLREVGLGVKLAIGGPNIGQNLRISSEERQLIDRMTGGSDTSNENCEILVNERRSLILAVTKNALSVVPLAALGIPDEPSLSVDIGITDLRVGVAQKVPIKPHDPRVKVEYLKLPDGAVETQGGLDWNPDDSQVGTCTIPLALKVGEMVRNYDAVFQVTQPFTSCPIAMTSFVVDESAGYIVCWNGSRLDNEGRPIGTMVTPGPMAPRVAVISLKAGKAPLTLSFDDNVWKVVVGNNRIAVVLQSKRTSVDVYDLNGLKKIKTLDANGPLTDLTIEKDSLLLHMENTTEVYHLSSFKAQRPMAGKQGSWSAEPNRELRFSQKNQLLDGRLIEGVLFNLKSNDPLLLVSPMQLPVIGQPKPELYSGSFLRSEAVVTPLNKDALFTGPLPLPGKQLQVSLEDSFSKSKHSDDGVMTPPKQLVTLLLHDQELNVLDRIPIVNETSDDLGAYSTSKATIQVTGSAVYVSVGNRIYRWKYQPPKRRDGSQSEDNSFHVVPEQQHFVLNGNKTTLKHNVLNAKGSVEFTLLSDFAGVQINRELGTVTINQSELLDSVTSKIRQIAGNGDLQKQIATIQAASTQLSSTISKRLKAKISGFPVAITISFQVKDEEGQVATMQYFVIADISLRKVRELLQ
ncbi:MAG: hypothetical protein U0930_02250 [Pirellulales bacterium]